MILTITTLQFLMALLIVFLGLFIGLFIAFFTKEELKQGQRYFVLLQRIIPLITLVLLIVFLKNKHVWLISLAFLVIYLFVFGRYKPLLYWAFSVIFFLSAIDKTLFIMNSLLIFIYGLPEGTLYFYENKKQKKTELFKGLFKHYFPFLLIALILIIISLL